jgi:hypothetical protein
MAKGAAAFEAAKRAGRRNQRMAPGEGAEFLGGFLGAGGGRHKGRAGGGAKAGGPRDDRVPHANTNSN